MTGLVSIAILGLGISAGAPPPKGPGRIPGKAAQKPSGVLVGLSANGVLAAWRQDVRVPNGDSVDQYSLIRVVETSTGKLVALFRDTDIRRVGPNGKTQAVSFDELVATHDLWFSARSRSEWVELQRKARFAPGARRSAEVAAGF